MLISHSHRFIFIHNYKVAGSSVRSTLEKYTERSTAQKARAFLASVKNHRITQKVGNKFNKGFLQQLDQFKYRMLDAPRGTDASAIANRRINRLKDADATLPAEVYDTAHLKAKHIKTILPDDVFNDYYKFGFVRNPWDWQVSLYEYALRNPNHRQHRRVKAMQDFEEYLHWRIAEDLQLQRDFFYEGDALLVDFVGKFEQLEEDFRAACNAIGIISPSLPHKLNSKKQHYLTYYSEKTLDLVHEVFRADVEAFGYPRPVLRTDQAV